MLARRQAIVLHDDGPLRDRAGAALRMAGFEVLATARYGEAEARARSGVDALVAGERVEGCLTHALLLLAEWRNPLVACVLLAEDAAAPDLLDLLPSLRAVLPSGTDPATLARLAAAPPAEDAESRLARLWRAAGDDEPEGPSLPVALLRRSESVQARASLPAFLTRRSPIHAAPPPARDRAASRPRPRPDRRLRLDLTGELPDPVQRRAARIRRLHLA
jgi:hypothetical protein